MIARFVWLALVVVFEPWTSGSQPNTPCFGTTRWILNSELTYFSASFTYCRVGCFFFFNPLCQTLRHPSWVNSGCVLQWKRVSPPIGGLTRRHSLKLLELDLVSQDLKWDTNMLRTSLESSQSDSWLSFNISLHYFPPSSLCSRQTSLPALPKSQWLCSFTPPCICTHQCFLPEMFLLSMPTWRAPTILYVPGQEFSSLSFSWVSQMRVRALFTVSWYFSTYIPHSLFYF